MLNHTATHLLNFCLNRVLGSVRQQGSTVSDTRLTFEFTCSKVCCRDFINFGKNSCIFN